jgi:hypothetical protein
MKENPETISIDNVEYVRIGFCQVIEYKSDTIIKDNILMVAFIFWMTEM